MCTINDNHMMYGFWDILDHFLPFYPPNYLKNQNFGKMKKPPGDITILHMCTIHDNHMMYGSWDMENDRQNFLSFWTVFCPFPFRTTWKNQNFEKLKKLHEDIIILHTCTKNHDHMLCCSWDMACNGCNCHFSFWAIFCPFTSLTAQKIKI